jgi:ElaB/YqjD/DUF883 family membrane-anchored ribosome-binding protein
MLMRHNGHRRPEEIEAEIERTRHDMDGTLTAIAERLTPGQLVDQGLDYMRNSGANEYLVNLRQAATRDPIPLALVGVGLAWLMMSSRRPAPATSPWDQSTSEQLGSDLKDKLSQTSHRMSESARDMRERASHMGETVRERASRVGETARQQAQRVSESARYQAERLRGSYQNLVNEQPLALGAVGLAIGALLAATTPRTRVEEEMFGGEGSPREPSEDFDPVTATMSRSDHSVRTEQGVDSVAAGMARSDDDLRSGDTMRTAAPLRSGDDLRRDVPLQGRGEDRAAGLDPLCEPPASTTTTTAPSTRTSVPPGI